MDKTVSFKWELTKRAIEIEVDKIGDSNYLFNEQINQVDKICKEIMNSGDKNINKVISVIGERGAGKSSLLLSAKSKLESNDVYTIGPIDPGVFDDKLNILELTLAHIHSIVKRNKNTFRGESAECQKIHLYNRIKSILQVLNNIRRCREDFIESNDTDYVLDDYDKRSNFSELLKELLDMFRDYINATNNKHYKQIAIIIDDLDLVGNSRIVNFLEDIRKYLMNNVIVVLAYRDIQLQNAMSEYLIKENDDLIRNKMIDTNEIIAQSTKYIDKFSPPSSRIYMPNLSISDKFTVLDLLVGISDSSKSELKEYLKLYGLNDDLPLKEGVLVILNNQLRINLNAIDARERNMSLLPTNLRGYLELFNLIFEKMEVVNCKSKDDIKVASKSILFNIELFKIYMQENYKNRLTSAQITIINEWSNCNVDMKNYLLYKSMIDSSENYIASPYFGQLLDLRLVQPFNVTLADVYIALEVYKDLSKEDQNYYFIYIIKILYSMELSKNYVNWICSDSEEDGEVFLDSYLTILNSYVIPNYWMDGIMINISRNIRYDNGNKNEVFENFYKNCVYNQVTALGLVNRGARQELTYSVAKADDDIFANRNSRLVNPRNSKRISAFRYRKIFSSDYIEFENGRSYEYDFFGFIGRRSYLEESKAKLLSNQEMKLNYVLTSLFDIDVFISQNYFTNDETNIINIIIKNIDKLFNGERLGDEENSKAKDRRLGNLSSEIFTSSINYENFYLNISSNNETTDNNKYREISDSLYNFIKQENIQLKRIVNNIDKIKNKHDLLSFIKLETQKLNSKKYRNQILILDEINAVLNASGKKLSIEIKEKYKSVFKEIYKIDN